MEEALRAFLLGDTSITSLVGDRVSWSWREQGSPLSALTLHRTDGARDTLLSGGASGFVDGYVQADCWGALQLDAKTLARAVVRLTQTANVGNTDGVIQGVFVEHEVDTFEGESPDRVFRTRLSLRVPHNEV